MIQKEMKVAVGRGAGGGGEFELYKKEGDYSRNWLLFFLGFGVAIRQASRHISCST